MSFDLKILRLQKSFAYFVSYQTPRHKREKEKKKTHERREPFINYIKVFLGKTDFLISFLFSLFLYTERTINDVKDETPMKLTPRMAGCGFLLLLLKMGVASCYISTTSLLELELAELTNSSSGTS